MTTRKPTHPGAILREDVLPHLGLTVSTFARSLGISRQNPARRSVRAQRRLGRDGLAAWSQSWQRCPPLAGHAIQIRLVASAVKAE